MKTGIAVALAVFFAVFLTGCGDDDSNSVTDIPAALEEIVRTTAADEAIPSVVLKVDDRGRGILWSGAAGQADPSAGTPMTAETQFRTASVTKMLTATVVMRLVEEGQLLLDNPVAGYLAESGIPFDSLLVYQNHSYGSAITLRQCLQHTTGLADYVFDGERNMSGYTPFLQYVLDHPTLQWQPLELVQWTYRRLPAKFAPGSGWHYSDANYVLLGMVIEAVTGAALEQAYHVYLLDPLGMTHTYLETRETPTSGGVLSHPFLGNVDTAPINTSFDWAGGGLVSTVDDLTRFLRVFAADSIFSNGASKQAMFSWYELGGGVSYGLGVARLDFPQGVVWGHDGAYGSFMYYWPAKDLTMCGTINQVEADVGEFEARLMRVLR
ncbi:beta-lactamase family protein [bacterium]|nr:beta-lactamase family protein [bacterium]MBU1983170.1 beta-lactamase family protein [bacterium]